MENGITEKLPISLCVIVHNSGGRLRKLIESLRDVVTEVIVADQASTDGTYEDAVELADLVLKRRHKGTADPDRNLLFTVGSQPWVLYLDDDEVLEQETKESLGKLIQAGADAVWFKRNNFIDGVDARQICGDDAQCRLFRVGAVRFPDAIHQYPEPADHIKVLYSKLGIRHERSLDGLVKANKSREAIASPQAKKAQDDFLQKVQAFFTTGLRPSR